jgi:hypothetical protein
VTPFVRDTFNAGSWPVTATFTGLGTRQTFSVR